MSIAAEYSPVRTERDDVAARRAALFRESGAETLRRWTLGAAWALRPGRAAGLPALARLWLKDLVNPSSGLPDPRAALARPAGLCGMARDLSVPALVEAYRRGLYPFAHFGPLKWWSPPERCILDFGDFHISKRLRGRLRQGRYRVTFDRDFDAVMKACAAPRQGKWSLTWITPTIMQTFAALHDAGHAHSFEVWNTDGALVGGGYGVAIGAAFTIESQFTRESHSSKIGFAVLNWHLAHWGFRLADNKGATRNTLETGFRVVPRATFCARLADAVCAPGKEGRWQVEADAATVAAWQPGGGESRPEAARAAGLGRNAARGVILLPVIGALDGLALAETLGAVL